MHLLSRPRLVMLEIAAAAAVVGYVYGGPWLPVGAAVAVVFLALPLVPWRGRPLYQAIRSWFAMRARRRRRGGPGIASLANEAYEVVTVPPGSGGVTVGAIRDARTWSVPLSLPLASVLNDDPPIPLEGLASLLTVEDVPLSSVRLVTIVSPPTVAAGAPAGPVPPASRLATRYLVLTLDTVYAADAIAARGGEAAVHQILRRCVLRAEEVLAAAGPQVRRLPEGMVAPHSASCLGPIPLAPDGTQPVAVEALDRVEFRDAMSVTFAVTGENAVAQLDQLATLLPAPIVATSVVLQPGTRRQPVTLTLLIRMSGPADAVRTAAQQLPGLAQQLGLRVHRQMGDQLPALKATTLLGLTVETAA